MVNIELVKDLATKTESRIVMIVVDGLGGLPDRDSGLTALESARTPNLDELASRSSCGLVEPVALGITPGSGPSHLALFGYDPLRYEIGRGVLEALGVGLDLQPTDVAARGNFCTVDGSGVIIDRRAGRIATERNRELVRLLRTIELEGAEAIVEPGKLHRFVVVFRGEGLSGDVEDTDPQHVGERPCPAVPRTQAAARTADLVNEWLARAARVLRGEHPANMVLLRGFAKHPDIPSMSEAFKLNPAAIATYPMYRGVARLVGMRVLETGTTIADQVKTLSEGFRSFDFFYVHVKETDSAGEDGDFSRRLEVLEELDRNIPAILGLQPDVLIVTGDHSTPSTLKAHSWHPVPILLFSRWVRPEGVGGFGEGHCAAGRLGVFPSLGVMPLAMANALKLAKFGA